MNEFESKREAAYRAEIERARSNGRYYIGWRSASYCSDASWAVAATETDARAFASLGAPFAVGVLSVDDTPHGREFGRIGACGGNAPPDALRDVILRGAEIANVGTIPGTRIVAH